MYEIYLRKYRKIQQNFSWQRQASFRAENCGAVIYADSFFRHNIYPSRNDEITKLMYTIWLGSVLFNVKS